MTGQEEGPMGKAILFAEGLLATWFLWRGLYPDFYHLIDVTALASMWAAIAAISAVALSWRSRKIFESAAQWSIWVGMACLVTLLIALKVPMRAGFLTARAELSQLVESKPDAEKILAEDVRIGLYTFSASQTNRRHRSGIDAGKHRVFLLGGNQSEAAFIHSTEGIESLVYNGGNKGHLVGDWYWMKED
jgi:hypothetical protein